MIQRGAMAYWRNASTLLLAVRQSASLKENDQGQQRRIVNNMQSGNEAESVDNQDYKLLMLKRNAKSSFFPAGLVFPGGTLSPVDNSSHWKPLFERVAGETMLDLTKHFAIGNGDRPPIITESSNDKNNVIPAEIALRICAIRETFEECGILLVTNRSSVCHNSWYDLDTDVKAAWQRRINENAVEFLTLCHQLSVVPNIWALHEWSNWLTPVMDKVQDSSKMPKRFDTMFFLCCTDCESLPEITVDNGEIVDHQWLSPSEYHRNIRSLSPQSYEMNRLTKFGRLNELREFSKKRQELGLQRLMSVRLVCHDAVLFVLPGDELYPDNPDCFGTQDADNRSDLLTKSYVEICNGSSRMHRQLVTREGKLILLCNCEMPCGHVPPASLEYPSKL